MAVTKTYAFTLASELDPPLIGANAGAASLAGGGAVVVGDHIGHTDLTLYDAAGAVLATAQGFVGTQAAVTQLSNGNVVVLTDSGGFAAFTILDGTTGVQVVGTQPATGSYTDVLNVDIAALASGFVCVTQHFFGTDHDIRVSVRNSLGTESASFAIDATTADDVHPSVAALADGGFAVAWHRNVADETEVWYAVYNANGSVRSAPALLDSYGSVNRNAQVVALDTGGFAIAYEDNGWSLDEGGTDIDVTVARFADTGALLGWSDVSRNSSNDTLPSVAKLANGMLVVGSTSDAAADSDVFWTLVDPQTGEPLNASLAGSTLNDDSWTAVAGLSGGRFGAWFTDAGTGRVQGNIFDVERTTTGDATANVIRCDILRDIVHAGDGNDTIRGRGGADSLYGNGGNDTFEVRGTEAAGDLLSGGAGSDRVLALAGADLRQATFQSIEEIEFRNDPAAAPSTVMLAAASLGAGLAANLRVDGNANGVPDVLHFTMGSATALTLAGLNFIDFDTAAAEGDRIRVQGDSSAETITGSSLRDEIFAGGGNDTLTGGGGKDRLEGGAGNDVYVVNVAGEAVEAAAAGLDTVRSTVSYTLGANLENLVLLGTSNTSGSGNALANDLRGNGGANVLAGSGGNDAIQGGAGNDVLRGGIGTDHLTGGTGEDVFDFNAAADTGLGAARDVVADFAGNGAAAGDRIDLSGIDANTALAGNQAFAFVGGAAFTAAGQLRYAGGILYGNLDADAAAEFEIALTGSPALHVSDLVL